MLFTILACIFGGCTHDNNTGFVVQGITCDSHYKPYCTYFVRGAYNLEIRDTFTKWNIGDTLYLNTIHKCKCN